MTYGETAAALRRELVALLVEAEVPKTRPGRRPLSAEDSLLVQRYRTHVLDWIDHTTSLVVPRDVTRQDLQWGPARSFAEQLANVTEISKKLAPALDPLDLGRRRDSETVERWRRAAASVTIGREIELGAFTPPVDEIKARRDDLLRDTPYFQPTPDHLDPSEYLERLRVVDDNAALMNALVLLDLRVSGRPGWHYLGDLKNLSPRRHVAAEGLLNSVELCRRWTRAHDLPVGIDGRGHQPERTIVDGPVPPGMPGVVTALQNTLTRLEEDRPRGDAMRLLIRSQAGITVDLRRAASRGDDPALPRLTERRALYAELLRASGALGGRLGSSAALVESEQARAVLATVAFASRAELRSATDILQAIDARVGRHILEGAEDSTYAVAAGKHIGLPDHRGIRTATTTWDRLDSPAAADLLTAAHRAARSPAAAARASLPTTAPPGRELLDATIVASTPASVAESSPLRRAPQRAELGTPDQFAIRRASFPSAAVTAATYDYLLRRPHRGGGERAKEKQDPER